jgi:tetratricopeptide (TPR) repeat protein
MKKKAAAKVKASSAKSKKTKGKTRAKGRGAIVAPAPVRRPNFAEEPRYAQAVQNYEAGLKAMQEHKFERAKGLLEKVVKGASRELGDRALVHLNTCNQQLARSSTSFKTPEEHYDFAVSLMNSGSYDEARTHLEKIQKQSPKADYAVYGLAALSCLMHKPEDALRYLATSIKMNSMNRLQARNDTDFQNLADDPRFTELLYPEASDVPPVTTSGARNR